LGNSDQVITEVKKRESSKKEANENNPGNKPGGSKTLHNGSSFSGGKKYSGR